MSGESRLESLFFAALEKQVPAERAELLDQACGDDAALRRRVQQLLDAYPKAEDFLARPALESRDFVHDTLLNLIGDTRRSGVPAVPGDSSLCLGLSEVTRGEDGSDEPGCLCFLEPSGKPGSLGRVAHYEVLEVLGQGGFGTVVKAFDEKLHRHVAIKFLSPLLVATSAPRKRFVREARFAASVRHENVVAVHAVEEQPIPWLVMEYIPGATLQQKLAATGPLEMVDVVRIGRQVAAGLAAAHAIGLIHRDIKPGNILLEDGSERVKLTDFGLARAVDDAGLTRTGVIVGTPMYMAPEQARGRAVDQRADLFSLGSLLYAMCSGRPPFGPGDSLVVLNRVAHDQPRPIRELNPHVPEWLCGLIERLHAKDPADRIASAQEVFDLLTPRLVEFQHAGDAPLTPGVVAPAAEQPTQFIERADPADAAKRPRVVRRRAWSIGATVLLMLLGGFTFTEANGVTHVHSTVIRLFTPEGILVVEVDDPGVGVKVDGSELVITGAGIQEIRLPVGQHLVEATRDGDLINQELVHVTRNGRPVVQVRREARTSDMSEAEWERSVASLDEADRAEAVIARLQELNPDPLSRFLHPYVDFDLAIWATELQDISPVRAMPGLECLNLDGKGINDISSLRDMGLIRLNVVNSEVSDLSPLQGLQLRILDLTGSRKITDLSPLNGLPLERLTIASTSVSDLTPLEGMHLTLLNCETSLVSDLSPLKGMPLTDLHLKGSAVTDLAPLQDLPLERLTCNFQASRDTSVLQAIRTLKTINGMPVEQFWNEVAGQVKDQ